MKLSEWKREKPKLGKKITEDLYKNEMILTWYRDKPEGWALVSGIWSPYYVSLRPMSSYPELYRNTGIAMGEMFITEAGYEQNSNYKLVGVAYAGIPIANAVTSIKDIPSLWTRKLEGVKTVEDLRQAIEVYGQHAVVEGDLNDDDVLGVIDDLVTKFTSKEIALEQVRYEINRKGLKNVQCKDVGVLLDREQGAEQRAKNLGINLYSLIPFKSEGIHWLKGVLHPIEYEHITKYMEGAGKYQEPDFQKYLKKMAENK